MAVLSRPHEPVITVRHEGRGGEVVVDGVAYVIDHVEGGSFAVAFPGGNPPRNDHLEALRGFAARQEPPWAVAVHPRTFGGQTRSRTR